MFITFSNLGMGSERRGRRKGLGVMIWPYQPLRGQAQWDSSCWLLLIWCLDLQLWPFQPRRPCGHRPWLKRHEWMYNNIRIHSISEYCVGYPYYWIVELALLTLMLNGLPFTGLPSWVTSTVYLPLTLGEKAARPDNRNAWKMHYTIHTREIFVCN